MGINRGGCGCAEITTARVGELAATLCGEAFAATTGAQISVDGGNERVI